MKIKINGKFIDADENSTVLEAAQREGIEIPTLCYHEALGPYGACRLCVVEAESPMLRRSLMTSCNLRVSEGLIIDTESSLVKLSRKIILELLIGRSQDSKHLKELAKKYGVAQTRFHRDKSDDCVRCGICVRVCRDKIGVSALCFAGRGQKRSVTAEFKKLSELCIGCGACANLCPTGAIKLEDKGDERIIFLKDNVISRQKLVPCKTCSKPYATQRQIDYVNSRPDMSQSKSSNLCPECAKIYYVELTADQIPMY